MSHGYNTRSSGKPLEEPNLLNISGSRKSNSKTQSKSEKGANKVEQASGSDSSIKPDSKNEIKTHVESQSEEDTSSNSRDVKTNIHNSIDQPTAAAAPQNSSFALFPFCTFVVVAIVVLVAAIYIGPSLLGVEPSSLKSATPNAFDKFRKEFEAVKIKFPSQDKQTWSVILSSVKRVLSRKVTMPACILLIDESPPDQGTANCLADQLSKAYVKSIRHPDDDNSDPTTIDAAKKLDAASESLFNSLQSELAIQNTANVVNIHQLSGGSAMALHSFCDEGSAFPSSVIFLTVHNTLEKAAATKKAAALADDLLTAAWGSDLDEDKLSSLITRVAVSIATVKDEDKIICNEN